MNEYPDWVDFLRYLGLDPITVWVEYRPLLFLSLILFAAALIGGLYFLAIRMRGIIANYRHAFADRMSFYRSVYELDEKLHEPIFKALEGEPLVYAVPAIAYDDVPSLRKSVGHLLLTKTKLIYTTAGQKIEFPLNAFDDANVRDGNKHMELKLIFNKTKPVFHLLGISRDHAQEIFMKMHAFRLALKEAESNQNS